MDSAEVIYALSCKSVAKSDSSIDARPPRYNAIIEAAMQEARDIMTGKVKAQSYNSASELLAALDE
ncbi:type II toxin-antitoxin system antitoxin, RelB/DinJ family [uncultured Senegalimassilia sp.]|uniref:type II toxin-antitoxin system antitoxin, RelB/DinJ family n=1 Tax=uncultured Senegalimassilia sp. TaxID=1714350 RepID=UPI0027DD81D5|nr:type II toxin-antitoxin system antitoxin, RelB/DinJ family [uncultured Senegalimassilia sp.]